MASGALLAVLADLAARSPDAPACSFVGRGGEVTEALTRGQSLEAIRRAAGALADAGVRVGDPVLLFLPTGPALVRLLLGLQWLGAIPVPLPELARGELRGAQRERIIAVVADCSPRAALVDAPEAAARLGELAPGLAVWCAGALEGAPRSAGPSDAPERPAFLQYTSGTTGSPKGVVISHRALASNLEAMRDATHLTSGDVGFSWMPLYHDMGLVGGLLLALYVGLPLYLAAPSLFLGGPATWLRSISRYRVTASPGTNFAYHLCARRLTPAALGEVDLSCWRLAFTGAETIQPATLRAFSERFAPVGFSERAFVPVYGLAEATLAVTFPSPGAPVVVDRVRRASLAVGARTVPAEASAEDAAELVGVGAPLPGLELLIADPETGAPLPERFVGQIVIAGPSLFSGYFHAWRAGASPARTLATGDLGYLAAGQLFVVDRLRDLIKIAGANYFPSDLERVTAGVAGVRRAVAFEVADADAGTGALALVLEASAAREERGRIEAEVRARLLQQIGLAPRHVAFAAPGRIPLTSSGKIQRRACRDLFLSGAFSDPLTPEA